MENADLRVMLSNLGCQLLSIEMKDADGVYTDVILRPKDPGHPERDGSYMGSIVGRVANRISDGKFTLNDKEYTLAQNNGSNCTAVIAGSIADFLHHGSKRTESLFHMILLTWRKDTRAICMWK
jgi:galactose mutarotase-like enzyme